MMGRCPREHRGFLAGGSPVWGVEEEGEDEEGVRCCSGAAGAPPGAASSARDGEEDAACAAGEEDAAPSRGQGSPISGGCRSSSRHRSRPAALGSSWSRSSRIPALLPRTGPGEEEEGGLSLSVPPQNHLERGEAPEQLTRNIQVCQGQVLAGRSFGFPGVWSRRSLVPPRGKEGTFIMSTRTSPGDTPSPPCPPAVAAGRRQRARAARR
ncbi:uncharacterized protein [Molothrus aeneus]|uniref:uncharacterized protein isoform X1 n=1 Tax=Molothrus aeneus TaxID=84833 RepID=UPI0034592E98